MTDEEKAKLKSDAARALKSLDKFEMTCQICGKKFIASKSAKFCSNACSQKNKYAKMKAKKEISKEK